MNLTRRGLAGVAAILACAPVLAQGAVTPLIRFPSGTFLENLVVLPDGRVLFTSYFARRVEMWGPGGHTTFAETPFHPVSLGLLPDGRIALTGHGVPFLQGPAALRGTNALALLSPEGRVVARHAVPDAVFLNGTLVRPSGEMLVVDSALGRVWALGADGAARVWLDHAALAPSEARPGIPGANGIKAAGGDLLLSNSASGMLLRLAAGSPTAEPRGVARFPGIDDFAVLPDGTVWAATHGSALARLRPGASEPEAFAVPGLEGNTAVLPVPGAAALYVLGTGGLAEGGRGEAMLARFDLPPG
jgi:sugar lactone lactonase YvrE